MKPPLPTLHWTPKSDLLASLRRAGVPVRELAVATMTMTAADCAGVPVRVRR